METPLLISSINRESGSVSDFLVKFDPPMFLGNQIDHKIGLDRYSGIYSCFNISDQFNNREFSYSINNGLSFTKATIPSGSYSYSDLSAYIKELLSARGIDQELKPKIDITFDISTFRVLIELEPNFQLDLRQGNFHNLIGFEQKIITSTEYGKNLPNITTGIDGIHVHLSDVSSLTDGVLSNTLCIIPTSNLRRGHSFDFEPKRILYQPFFTNVISDLRISIRDPSGRILNLNEVDIFMSLIIKSE